MLHCGSQRGLDGKLQLLRHPNQFSYCTMDSAEQRLARGLQHFLDTKGKAVKILFHLLHRIAAGD
ncbi:hypothetical protein D3C77_423380 [compost metagenome]